MLPQLTRLWSSCCILCSPINLQKQLNHILIETNLFSYQTHLNGGKQFYQSKQGELLICSLWCFSSLNSIHSFKSFKFLKVMKKNVKRLKRYEAKQSSWLSCEVQERFLRSSYSVWACLQHTCEAVTPPASSSRSVSSSSSLVRSALCFSTCKTHSSYIFRIIIIDIEYNYINTN